MLNMNNHERIIYWVLSLTLVVDALNGLVMNLFDVELSFIGIIFRVSLICIFLYYYCRLDRTNIAKIGLGLIFFSINIGGGYYLYNNTASSLIFDIMETMRLCLSLILSMGLINLLKKGVIKRDILINVIIFSIKTVIFVYIFSLLSGLGNSTYGDTGYKAIFNSNNGLNITLIILFIFQVERTLTDKIIRNIVYSIFLFLILILLGSKSSFIFIAFYFLLKIIYLKRIKEVIKYTIFLCLSIGIIVIIINSFFSDIFEDIFSRQLYFFEKESSSLHTYFLSGRDILLSAAYQNFNEHFSLYSLIFGVGSYFHQLGTATVLKIYSFKNIEMDFFDILFSYGVIGILITYGYHLYIFFLNKKRLINNGKYPEVISFLCIMIFSFTGGHVYTDAMASTFLAIIVSLLWSTK